MISQNRIKFINSLAKKKYREENNLFIAEGSKLTIELLNSKVQIKWIFAISEWIEKHNIPNEIEVIQTTPDYIKKISQLKTPPPVISICEIPDSENLNINFERDLILTLDDIQDPGNMGTIIRLADWFGVKNIICSQNTVDAFNPKVIQATMGAIARVNIHYTNLNEFLLNAKERMTPIYGTFLDGNNIYRESLTANGIIVMGNEGKGISQEIEKIIDKKILIPSFSLINDTSESLNVSTATAITLSEFRRLLN